MSGTKVFWLEPTSKRWHELRRYAPSDAPCLARPYGMTCHDARVTIGIVERQDGEHGYHAAPADADSWKSDRITRADPQWPVSCACGYVFTEDDVWQVNLDHLYEARGGPHDGQLFTLRDAPPGAMWDASWYRRGGAADWATGPDGLWLVVRLPNGHDWLVDQEASNCTRTQYEPTERGKRWTGRTHYCWVRHGDPRTGNVHVDKGAPGESCAAGAGSIAAGSYHGFLHHGYLTPA